MSLKLLFDMLLLFIDYYDEKHLLECSINFISYKICNNHSIILYDLGIEIFFILKFECVRKVCIGLHYLVTNL